MLYLSQRDPRWANIRIGEAWFTLGQKGCALTALCESLSDFGIIVLPDRLAIVEKLFTRRSDQKNGPGLLIWGEMEKWLADTYPNYSFSLKRYYGRNDPAIRQNLRPGSGVLLEVADRSHWVKADRKMLLRNDYNCRDPWGGKGCAAIGDYRNITGFVILKVE